ncbi:unnamed protein product [Nezara viridula]|uniref:Peptidase S1 domain-containing protein n=1 Tax=Nezara viridula TaxID=85310 RepID=A0A9P0HJ70_NEZVI|nr:unnamed protein product [Nezara viridula]
MIWYRNVPRTYVLTFFLFILYLLNNFFIQKQVRIIGGEETSPNQYPFMLVLVLTEGLRHFCGASILSEKHAITAAHCTEPLGDRAISVIAGAHDKTKLTENTMVVPVEKHIEHEYYNPVMIMNDISLLFLAEPLKFGPNISPICMPTKKMYLENQDVKIIGWGMTAPDKPPSIVLKEIDVTILPYIRCKGNFLFMYNPLPWKVSQICTGAKAKGACRGDSGGPVIYLDPQTKRWVLVGLVSFGAASCDPDSPTVETDATYYVPWIESHLKGAYCHKV